MKPIIGRTALIWEMTEYIGNQYLKLEAIVEDKLYHQGKLYYQGHVYVFVGTYPCPIDGAENGMIPCKYKGRPAWWQDGYVYVLDEEQSVNIPVLNDWVRKVRS